MLKKQKGITAGMAVLITVVVAATVCGGLYLVTQFQSAAPEKYSLAVSKKGTGRVVLEPEGGAYKKGEEVTVKALAPPGGRFEGWTGDVLGDSSSITVVMDTDKRLTAHFGKGEGKTQWAGAIENCIKKFYPPDDVGYEILSKSENRVKGFVYLRGENRVPFRVIKLKLENGSWNCHPGAHDITIRSPSKNLKITGYKTDDRHACLEKIKPTVKNRSSYPAFVSSVHVRIENSTRAFRRSYSARVRCTNCGIVPSGRTVEVGEMAPSIYAPKWSSDGSKTILRTDELAGESFQVTLTLEDGEGATLAKRTFHTTFENLPVSKLVEENKFVYSNLEREENPHYSLRYMSHLVDRINQFAFDLYRQIRNEEGNLFYSPYSISTALSMTYAGARGETARQIDNTLHSPLLRRQYPSYFNGLSQSLEDRENFTLTLVNALWGQDNWKFKEGFLDTLALHYGAGMHRLDFWRNPDQARQIVNEWVENRTENKIENLVPSGAFQGISPAALMLTSAVYFKASWKHSFPENQTQERAFTLPSGENVRVPMMSSGQRPFLYTEGKNYKAIKIPYLGKVSMTVILPDEGHFREVERDLDAEFLKGVKASFKEHTLTLEMPKFSFESKFDLSNALKEMGMPIAFTRAANFSGMTPDTPVWIEQALHQAYISVDEKGTEAAAGTSVEIVTGIGPKITLDRPFIFLIRSDRTGTILFAGRVVNPVA